MGMGRGSKTPEIDISPPEDMATCSRDAALKIIKDHPNRSRRRSSVVPTTAPIREEGVLEDLCLSTGCEPDVPVEMMRESDLYRLIQKISEVSAPGNSFSTSSNKDLILRIRKLSLSNSQMVDSEESSDSIPTSLTIPETAEKC